MEAERCESKAAMGNGAILIQSRPDAILVLQKINGIKLHKIRSGVVARYLIQHEGARWAVRKADSSEASCIYKSQAEAISAAQQMVRDCGGQIFIQSQSGKRRESFTLGREGFAKISAVEGLHVPASLMLELRDLDKRGLSGDARRREIMRKYGKS